MQNKNFYHNKALNNISVMVFYLDEDFIIQWANQAAIEYFDIDLDYLESQKYFKKCNKKNNDCLLIKAKETKKIEEKIMEKHNNRICKIKVIPELNEAGELEGFIKLVLDISLTKELGKDKPKYIEISNANDYNSKISEAIQQKKLLDMNKFFIDNADLMIFRVTPEGIIGYVNQTAVDKLNYSEEEFCGLPITRLIPNDEFIPRDAFWKRIKDKDSLTYERNFITKDGDSFPVEITSQYFKYGKKEYEFVFVKDIIKRKKTEKKLRYNQERYQTIFNSAPIGIMIEDKNGDILETNEIFCEQTGYSKGELKGKSVLDKFVSQEDQEFARDNINKVLKGEDLEIDVKDKIKNGEIKYFNLKETDIILPDGNKGIISMHIDITARKNKEIELKKQKDKLNWIIEGTNSGTWEWNIQTGETVFNEMWAEMIGYTLEELQPTTIETWKKFTHPEDLKRAEKALEDHFNGDKPFYSAEMRMRHKEGHWVWILDKGKVTAWTEEGRPFKMFGTHLDISDQKESEKIIKEINKAAIELQSLNQEEDICQKTIETAKKMLNFDLCGIALVKNNEFVPAATSDQVKFQSLPKNYGVMGKAFKDNESYLNSDLEEDPDAKPINNNYKSGMAIPMHDIGVFQAVSTKKNDFNQRDLELAEILISSTKAALERVYYQEKLRYKSFHDSLTDLYNRRFFEEEMQRIDTERQLPLSIIMTDLNGLKIINDSYGHEKGDEILIKTAEILKEVFRKEDIIARQGGDEFAILLPETNNKQVNEIVKRIKNQVEIVNKKEDIPVSMAVGSATKEDVGQDIKEVLRKADDNMYQNKLSESRSSKSNIVQGLLNTLNAKSSETKEHAMRMTKLAFHFGDKLNLSNSELNRLSLLATMHDIGKTTISEEILNKPGELSREEWEVIKKHSEKGYKIATASEEFALIADEILAHHEKWDGSGYPNGLKGEEIPYLARVISIVDAYDVMTNERPYSKAISKENALAEIKDCAGSQFDPDLAEVAVKVIKNY